MIFTGLLFISVAAWAASGGHDGNGGDSNEPNFKAVAANISEWIQSGNADSIQLPAGVSLSEYKGKMLDVLSGYQISFTADEVVVLGQPKTCKNWIDQNHERQIRCNLQRFAFEYQNDINEIYRLVHHEFAGLAGLESNSGQNSKYAISNQISAYLEDQVVKRLPVTSPQFQSEGLQMSPACYRGTLTMSDAEHSERPVFLSFSSIKDGYYVIVEKFRLGNSSMESSGSLITKNEISFNDNNDYIPGGDATYNVDVDLKFVGNTVTGFYKKYEFKEGFGGFGESDPSTLVEAGTLSLKKCQVVAIDQ